jgi:D-glycero-alpha-D-manno-heptose-7-phosphate kinase
MIGTRTPFRISFAGGGSDFRDFYRQHPGAVVSVAIDRYMYIFVHPFFEEKIQVKYSKTELVDRIADVQHPIVREVLKQFQIGSIDINSVADIPAGTGLGSSSAFTVGLLHALYAYTSRYVSNEELAAQACQLEIDRLGEPIGKQDQYAVAYGGLNFITFYPNEAVNVEPILMPGDTQSKLEQNIILFYLGAVRSARTVLEEQQRNIASDAKTRINLVQMTALADQLRRSLQVGTIDDMGLILDESWQRKKRLAQTISSDRIDQYYKRALRQGALGGKLLGAGGGGFLLFYCPPEKQADVVAALSDLRPMKFGFDTFGTKVIHVSEQRQLTTPRLALASPAQTAIPLTPAMAPPEALTPPDPVSVIINVYNEAKTIEQEIRDIHRLIVAKIPGSELIVAEDGSTDGTKEIITHLINELGIIHSTSPERKGYTKALRDALALAKNPYIFFSDTGGKFDFEDFWKLYPYRKDYGVVSGIRTGRTDQLYRQALTWGYNFLVRQYFNVRVRDADSGFRLYDRRLIQELLQEPWVYKNLIGSELVVRALYKRYKVKEVPVTYRQRDSISRGLPPQKIPRVIRQTLWSFPELKRHLKKAR